MAISKPLSKKQDVYPSHLPNLLNGSEIHLLNQAHALGGTLSFFSYAFYSQISASTACSTFKIHPRSASTQFFHYL